MKNTLEAAKRELSKEVKKRGPRLLTPDELQELLQFAHRELGVAKSVREGRLLAFLVEHCGVRELTLESKVYEPKTRYVFGELSPYVVAVSLYEKSYLTHASAVFLHGLTDQVPKTLYVNREQSPQRTPRLKPSQERIDRAFSQRQRLSKLTYSFDGYAVVVLAGKNTRRLGVISASVARRVKVPVTGLERTLIDIVVRPAYSGGLVQVLEAYKRAVGRVSVPRLLRILKRLDYVYPYHQAIGFLMERAGLPAENLEPLRAMGTPFRFYLGYALRETAFDEKWQMNYPRGL
jgi:predicted transcriptional regulator of viral defense system